MSSKRRSPIWTISKDKLQSILDKSSTIKEVIRKLGYADPSQGAHNRRLHQRIKEDSLDTTKFESNCKLWRNKFNAAVTMKRARPIEEYFIENSTVRRESLKKKLVDDKLIPFICAMCGIKDTWNERPLSLHLDHINGVNNDNRLENLRFLCPNCHSQTETYSGKNSTSRKMCVSCNTNLPQTTYGKYCSICKPKNSAKRAFYARESKRKFHTTKEELIKTIQYYSGNMTSVGKHYGVSCNSIRKRCRLYNIDWSN